MKPTSACACVFVRGKSQPVSWGHRDGCTIAMAGGRQINLSLIEHRTIKKSGYNNGGNTPFRKPGNKPRTIKRDPKMRRRGS